MEREEFYIFEIFLSQRGKPPSSISGGIKITDKRRTT